MSQLAQAGLVELEAVIADACRSFVVAGEALTEICERRLYLADYTTFDDYCRGRWQMSPQHAYRLIQAFAVVECLSPSGLQLPQNERQARELAGLPPPLMQAVWMQALGEGDTSSANLADLVRDYRAAMPPQQMVEVIRKGEDQPAPPPAKGPPNWPRRLENAERLLGKLQEKFPAAVAAVGESRVAAAVAVLDELARAVKG